MALYLKTQNFHHHHETKLLWYCFLFKNPYCGWEISVAKCQALNGMLLSYNKKLLGIIILTRQTQSVKAIVEVACHLKYCSTYTESLSNCPLDYFYRLLSYSNNNPRIDRLWCWDRALNWRITRRRGLFSAPPSFPVHQCSAERT